MSPELPDLCDYFHFWYQSTRTFSEETATLDDVILFVGQVARDAGDMGASRGKICDYMRESLPLAAKEGRGQVLVLSAACHVVVTGGMRGRLLAPGTLYDYFRATLTKVHEVFSRRDPEALTGEEFWTLYRSIVLEADIPAARRAKLSAMLEVFHRYLVIVGCEPLPRSIATGQPLAPPLAAVVWEHELAAAVDYVGYANVDETVKRQCILALRLGFFVPIRACEVWCIRLGDLGLGHQLTLDIYPRRRDGVRKSESTRRQVDIRDRELATLLLDAHRRREEEGATLEHVLFGDMSSRDARYKEFVATNLINQALKVATCDLNASFHDLRHTAFSQAAIPVLGGQRFAC